MTVVTWTWIEESLFPLVVHEAREVGANTAGWALDWRAGATPMLCVLDENKAVKDVVYQYSTPAEAKAHLEGMRTAYRLDAS